MKFVKTSVIACALSALLAGPVLAQNSATGGMQGKGMQQGGMGADDATTAQPSAPGGKMKSAKSKGTKGAAGTAAAARKGSAGTDADAAAGAAPPSGKHQ